MIETNLLAQFVAFAKAGTLTRAAQDLHTSQPALTRSMKKLEEELEVPLFVRHKNHLELTQTGRYAVYYAQRVLQENQDFCDRIRSYDRSLHTLSIGYCAPVPQMVLTPLLNGIFQGMTLSADMKDDVSFPEGLRRQTYQLAVMHARPDGDEFFVKKCGSEKLYLGPRIGPPGLLSGSPPAGPGWPGHPALFSYRLLDENDPGKDTARPLFAASPAGCIP